MEPYVKNIEEETVNNFNYRQVVYTGKIQLVLMALEPGEDIPSEIHHDRDQVFRTEQGTGIIVINNVEHLLKENILVIVPAGARHYVKNIGKTVLKLYTIYGPPEHKPGTIHVTQPKIDIE